MRSRFQQGLDELKEKLLRMGGLAERVAVIRVSPGAAAPNAPVPLMV